MSERARRRRSPDQVSGMFDLSSDRVEWGDIDRIARAFHDTYESLAPLFSYETREESAVPWEDVPEANSALMRAVVHHLLMEGIIR